MAIRINQEVTEVVSGASPAIRLNQEKVEAVSGATANLRLNQEIAEVPAGAIAAQLRVNQLIAEVIFDAVPAGFAISVNQELAEVVAESSSQIRVNQVVAEIILDGTAFNTGCNFTLQDMVDALSAELYDPQEQFWTTQEKIAYIQEAIRTWNALTGYWRGDFLFNSQQGVTWYDITSILTAPQTLRPLTLSTTDIYTILQYHLLEPPVGGGAWTGSAQFTLADLQRCVARRQNETLGVTGCVITQSLIPAVPGRTTLVLSSTVIDLRRVAFFPAPGQGSPSVMWQDDAWAWQQFEPGYTTQPPGTPTTYTTSTTPVFTFDVDRQPGVPGSYELLTVNSGVQTSAPPNPSGLSVPDDWTWVIKWGALADLLGKESNAKDVLRSKYAEGRYRQGLALLTVAPALLGLRVSNVPVQIDAVTAADQYQTTWEGQAQGTPSAAFVAGMNLLALSPAPDSAGYSLTATVIENAPIPVFPLDCLQMTQDVYESILLYAQHLAAFKMGGAEFVATEPMLQHFMSQAALYSSKIAEMGEFSKVLYAQSQLESHFNPRYSLDAGPEADE